MKAIFTLTPAESKRLIAKGVAVLDEVQVAMRSGMIIIGAGTTNAFVVEELTGEEIDKAAYTAGIITDGRQCVTAPEDRIAPIVLVDGKKSELSWEEAVEKMGKDDVFIKGGNAIDVDGVVGVQLADPNGGTIGKALPIIIARGAHLVSPVGLEKLIYRVGWTSRYAGIETFDLKLGMPVGMMPIAHGRPVTELEALEVLFDVFASHISSGGIDGSEGSVTLVIESFEWCKDGENGENESKNNEQNPVEIAFELIKSIKGEKPVGSLKRKCSACSARCDYPGK